MRNKQLEEQELKLKNVTYWVGYLHLDQEVMDWNPTFSTTTRQLVA